MAPADSDSTGAGPSSPSRKKPSAPSRPLRPEERELERKRAELRALESTLAERELELATLRRELAAFERRYLTVVGARYAELDEVNALLAESLSRKNPESEPAQRQASAARERAEESRRAVDDAEQSQQRPGKPSERLKALFRQVAKTVHPDLAGSDKERARRQKFMAQANQAYQDGDEQRLQDILREWEESPESVQGEGAAAELIRTIRKIAQVETRFQAIDAEISELKKSDLFALKTKADEAEAAGADLLAEMAGHVTARIAEARRAYERAVGGSKQ